MRRRALAVLVLTSLLMAAAVAVAKLPTSVTPKTGKYTGNDLESKKPGVLKISHPRGGGFRVSLNLTVHAQCEDNSAVQTERDIPVAASGKLLKALVNSQRNNKFVNSYKFTQKREAGGGPNVLRTFSNVSVEILSPTRAFVLATYNERTDDAEGKFQSSCNGGTRTWTLTWHK